MTSAEPVRRRPGSPEEAATMLRELSGEPRRVRIRGGGTKLRLSAGAADVEVLTEGLARIVEHNAGDFTASVQAGVRLQEAQAAFAEAGQMLALDPPLGEGAAATVGGVIASADSGPLRHRYGSARDLVLGVQVALSDGTLARAGGKVIKNVAGYDLAKLFTGSLGTLGMICEVSLRLHPLPGGTATLRAQGETPAALAAAALRLAAQPLEAESLDVGWQRDRGSLLVRFGGSRASERAARVRDDLTGLGLLDAEIVEQDEPLWAQQRAAQVGGAGTVKATGVISDLAAILDAARAAGADVVSRAALGLFWLSLPEAGDESQATELLTELRRRLPEVRLTPLGMPVAAAVHAVPAPAAAQVMARIKGLFDPVGIFPEGGW